MLKNLIIKIFYFIFKPRKINRLNLKKPKILIVSTTALGDTLWATPLIFDLRKTYPTAFIAVLTSSIGFEVLENNPFIDRLYILKKPLFLLLKLRMEKFQIVLLFHSSQRIIPLIISLLGAEKTISTQGRNKDLDSLFTHILKDEKYHEIDRRAKQLQELKIESKTKRLFFYPSLKDDHFVDKLNLPSPFIVLHPGASAAWRTWPKENFIELGKLLAYQIVLTGSLKEFSLLNEISSEIENSIVFYDLTLGQLAALYKRAKLLVIADTGPLHLASALNTPTIALFSPTNPSLCGSLSLKTTTIYKKPLCENCIKKGCFNPSCMKQITLDEVVTNINNLIFQEEL